MSADRSMRGTQSVRMKTSALMGDKVRGGGGGRGVNREGDNMRR